MGKGKKKININQKEILFGILTTKKKIILKMKMKKVFSLLGAKPPGWELQLGKIAPCGFPLRKLICPMLANKWVCTV